MAPGADPAYRHLHVHISPELHRTLRLTAVQEDTTVAVVVRALLETWDSSSDVQSMVRRRIAELENSTSS